MLNGKSAIVTGANRGIGRGIAIKLASLGAKVIINYRSDEEGAKEVLNIIKENGGEAGIFKADVSKFDDAEKLINHCKEVFGKVDILVNNAGITKDGLILRMKEEEFDNVIEVNLKGAFNCIRHVSPVMLKQKAGTIVNISSVIGIIGNAGQSNYAASKAGIIGLTKSIAKELGGRNIRVNAVAPGFIKTDMTDVLSEDIKQKLKSTLAIKRLGEVNDIAETVAFLCSDASSYITGQVINVDGGMVM